ncbi:hypothetical protein PHYBOEH_001093 [Phytophthora boehmeriae]|uniref:PX domain-containing protein n=1 Tax=Phytophthora boehmeriae TaxID=109152 RepID=A0A8T1WUL4_9STRA|nr:hypothetical protein PHYBOEH_001093 [Phytophthora boehmeriae]
MRESLPQQRLSMSLLNQSGVNERELRLWLLSASTHKGVTYYRIAGRFASNGQTWEVSHRYSEFLRLRDQLVKFLSSSTDKCPGCRNYLHSIQRFAFPKKHLFASRAPIVVNYRVKALRSFLNLLASWAFSRTPKCPTCGGFAFEVVRNFVLEGGDVSTAGDADMNSIRESVVVEAFSENLNSSRGSTPGTHMRKNSWMRSSTPSGRASQPDLVQSMHLPRQRPSQAPTDLPRPGVARAQSTEMEAPKILPPQKPYLPSTDRRHRGRPDDDPYDAFNDYLPERPSKMKNGGQASMETKVQSGKFSSRGLQELEEERRRQREESLAQQKLMKHRSEPRNLSAGRPLAESELSITFDESPRSTKQRTSRHNAESFISDASMAAEPVLLHGDEVQRYGVSDDEKKAKSTTSSVYSSDDEIDITGVTLASPPRATKRNSAQNLWQPWELARVA